MYQRLWVVAILGVAWSACSTTLPTLPSSDGSPPDGRQTDGSSSDGTGPGPGCGNGRVDPGELCDTAITNGAGSCPKRCDDGQSCTADALHGSACAALCEFTPITRCAADPPDGCCPAGCSPGSDPDCGKPTCGNGDVDPGEACDLAIPQGMPGACPQRCNDGNDCTQDLLTGTDCQQVCASTAITQCGGKGPSDGCCPPGCTNATDADCSTTCGNGKVDPGESCDTAIPPNGPGACPTACRDDSPCTKDVLTGGGCDASCSFQPILACDPGVRDGCCPPGCTSLTDADCTKTCGNSVLDSGETCDIAIPSGVQGSCPRSCDDGVSCTQDRFNGSDCTLTCSHSPITACNPNDRDGCCPAGCATADRDPDCLCGNGILEPGEKCDVAIKDPQRGGCPISCDDGQGCTADQLIGAGCDQHCAHQPITVCKTIADGCCPNPADPLCMISDPDCTISTR